MRTIFHVDVNSAFLSWLAVKLLRDNPEGIDLRTIIWRRYNKARAVKNEPCASEGVWEKIEVGTVKVVLANGEKRQ